MRGAWRSVCEPGLAEDEIRERLRALAEEELIHTTAALRAEGHEAAAVGRLIDEVRRLSNEEIEQALPMVVRELAVEAGTERVH
jgi:hypothetical protein